MSAVAEMKPHLHACLSLCCRHVAGQAMATRRRNDVPIRLGFGLWTQ